MLVRESREWDWETRTKRCLIYEREKDRTRREEGIRSTNNGGNETKRATRTELERLRNSCGTKIDVWWRPSEQGRTERNDRGEMKREEKEGE